MKITKVLKDLVDHSSPLPNTKQEKFCQEYLRLTLEGINTTKYKKTKAYIHSYEPDVDNLSPSILEQRANAILHNYDVQRRLDALLEINESSLEHKYRWVKANAEDRLIDIILSDGTKDADKIKAIQVINEIKGIKAPKEQLAEKENDALTSFLNRIGVGR